MTVRGGCVRCHAASQLQIHLEGLLVVLGHPPSQMMLILVNRWHWQDRGLCLIPGTLLLLGVQDTVLWYQQHPHSWLPKGKMDGAPAHFPGSSQ